MKTFSEFSESLKYHIDNGIPLNETIYRYGSEGHFSLINEIREVASALPLSPIEKEILATDIGKFGIYEGKEVPLDLPMIQEAQYHGKEVELGKPKRGGPKKYYVYVKNSSGNVIKVAFGDTSGLKEKIGNPEARKSFVARHKCHEKKDRTTPGYWSCRLPFFSKQLGLSGGGQFFW